MSDLIRGLTYTLNIEVPADLSKVTACELWIGVTLNSRLCHTLSDLKIEANDTGGSVISYTLTEAESLKLQGEQIRVQCRWSMPDGTIAGTKRATVNVAAALWDQEMMKQ